MDFKELRSIILEHEKDKDKVCLKYTDVYDTHNWNHHSTLDLDNASPGYVTEIYIYRCTDCRYFLDLTTWPYPGVEDFTGHHGDCVEEIKSCQDVIMKKALE